jgi:hypothetical protein
MAALATSADKQFTIRQGTKADCAIVLDFVSPARFTLCRRLAPVDTSCIWVSNRSNSSPTTKRSPMPSRPPSKLCVIRHPYSAPASF